MTRIPKTQDAHVKDPDTTALEAKLTKLKADAEATIAKLQEAVREAHGSVSDLNLVLKRATEVRKEFLDSEELSDKLRNVAEGSAQRYLSAIDVAIDRATSSVYHRFDTIMMLCLGIDPQSVSEGRESVEQLIRTFIKQRKLPYDLYPNDNDALPEAFRRKGVRILADKTMPEGEGFLVKLGPNGEPEVVEISGLFDFGRPSSLFGAIGVVNTIVPDDPEQVDDTP